MKTSNKLLLTALLIMLVTLVVYNVALTNAYKKGDYKDAMVYFNDLDFKGFDAVTVNAASNMTVEIVPGDYQVRVHKSYQDYVKIVQKGNELVLNLNFPDDHNRTSAGTHVLISVPELRELKANGVYTINGEEMTTLGHNDHSLFFNNHVLVKGFNQDSLQINQDNGSVVVLEQSAIKKLSATAGMSEGAGSKLKIARSNTIQKAELDIRQQSELVLEDIIIPELDLNFSKTAKTVLSGASLAELKK